MTVWRAHPITVVTDTVILIVIFFYIDHFLQDYLIKITGWYDIIPKLIFTTFCQITIYHIIVGHKYYLFCAFLRLCIVHIAINSISVSHTCTQHIDSNFILFLINIEYLQYCGSITSIFDMIFFYWLMISFLNLLLYSIQNRLKCCQSLFFSNKLIILGLFKFV